VDHVQSRSGGFGVVCVFLYFFGISSGNIHACRFRLAVSSRTKQHAGSRAVHACVPLPHLLGLFLLQKGTNRSESKAPAAVQEHACRSQLEEAFAERALLFISTDSTDRSRTVIFVRGWAGMYIHTPNII